jgi:isopenicillin N synthase-like dioxygenase
MIPNIDVAPLFGPACREREAADCAIASAASGTGFMTVSGAPVGPEQIQALKRIFTLDPAQLRLLWRQKFDADRTNVYRGWFPLQEGHQSYKEGIDMGPDIAYGAAIVDNSDPLREATPLPPEAALPGWRAAASAYYRAMELTGRMLLRAIARGLGLDEQAFDSAFEGGVSTLRLAHYPVRTAASLDKVSDPDLWVSHEGAKVYVTGAPHVDSGLVTLLAQDRVPGLQAKAADGAWIDVPPTEDTLAVNFGRLLERWTGGRIKATLHRVVGSGQERYSVPFFYEPRVDAIIAPLPLPATPGIKPAAFAPFFYGDYVWSSTTKFVEFAGLEPLRPPRGQPKSGEGS